MNRSKDFTEEEFLKRYGTPKPKRFSYSFGDVVRVLANNRVLNGLRAVVCADHEGGGRFPTYVEGHAVVWFDITEVEPLDAAEDTAEQLANLKKENEGLKHQIDVVCGYEMDKDIEAIGLREELAACKAEITKQSLSFDLLQAEANELSDTMTRQINEIMALDAEIERLRERVVVWHPLDEQEPPEARVYYLFQDLEGYISCGWWEKDGVYLASDWFPKSQWVAWAEMPAAYEEDEDGG